MKILKSKIILIFAVLFCFFINKSYTQENVELINSGDLIDQGVKLHDEEEYEEAIKIYEKISRNDTNYSLGLAELSLSLLANKDYEKTKEVCREGIKLESDEGHMFYMHYATALDDSDDPDSAIIVYKQGLKKYPNHQLMNFNLGITYYRVEKYQEAIDVLKKSILLNPYHSSSHMALGKICAELGYVTQAMLSLNMFLILEPGTQRSVDYLQYMDKWLGSDMNKDSDKDVILTEKGDDFSEIDVLIRNRVALNSKYKAKSKLTYPVVMQTQVLFEKLKYRKNDGGFWMENYVPVFKDIYRDGDFAPYIYYILSNLNSDKVQKLVKKSKKKIDNLTEILNQKIIKIRASRVIQWDGKKRDMKHWFYKSNKIQAIGEYDVDNEINKGYWEYYYYTGIISSKGNYNSKGEKIGMWEYYFNNGKIKEKLYYKEGKIDGYDTHYYNNGKILSTYSYKDSKANDTAKYYSNVGALTSSELFENDVLSGEGKRYFNNGKVHYSYTNKNGKLDEKLYEYDAKGQLIYECDYDEGKRNGIYKTYYSKGKVKYEMNYKNGEYDGDAKNYYYTGQIEIEGQYKEGKSVGKFKKYYIDGTLKEEYEYDEKGKFQGDYKGYDRDGKLHYVFVYEKDKMVNCKYFNKEGEIVKQGNKKGNKLIVDGIYPDGTKKVKGIFVNGEKDGEWTYYNNYGGIKDVSLYKDGKLKGISKEYFNNGNLSSELNYTKGEGDGYFKSYYSNGQLYAEGWYVKDEMQGDWLYYFANGKMKEHEYYLNGELEGTSAYYNTSGLLKLEEVYNDGKCLRNYIYDSLNNAYQSFEFDKKSQIIEYKDIAGNKAKDISFAYNVIEGPCKTYNYNGKLMTKSQYINGEIDGEYLKYNKDGKIISKKNYQLGELNGKVYEYFENGKMKYDREYVNDKAVGTWIWYFDNGKISLKKQIVDELTHGNVEFYCKVGLLELIKIYEYGEVIGYTYKGKNGKLVDIIYLDNGNGEIIAYYSNGEKSYEATYKDGYMSGPLKYYYPNGKLKSERNMVYGNYEGKYKQYYNSGKLKDEGNYIYDELDGLCKYYYSNGKIKKELTYVFGVLHGNCKYYNKYEKLTHQRIFYNGQMLSEQAY